MSAGPGDAGGLAARYARHRYAVLFYTLLLTLVGSPLLAALHLGADLLQILLAFSLLAALLGVPGQRWRTLLMVLAAVAVGLRAVPASMAGTGVATGASALVGVVALLAAASALRFALRGGSVDAEHLYAALSVYVLAGLCFGYLYWAIERGWPGSFAESGGAAGLPLSTAIYFSFVTIATLGYGDVVPKSEVARGLATLEAVGGQLYVAVLVARLVGARLQGMGGPPRRS
jgi:hypothetical protein